MVYVYVHLVREEADPDSNILGFPLGVEPKDVITRQIGTLNKVFKPVGKESLGFLGRRDQGNVL